MILMKLMRKMHGDRRPKLFGNTFKPVGHVGAVRLQIEQ